MHLQDFTFQIAISKNTPNCTQAVIKLELICKGSHFSKTCFFLMQDKHATAAFSQNRPGAVSTSFLTLPSATTAETVRTNKLRYMITLTNWGRVRGWRVTTPKNPNKLFI